jgi:TRAP-type C4-dicarboxylate transport system permease small subunit
MKMFELADPDASSRVGRAVGGFAVSVAAGLFIALLVINLVQVFLRSITNGLIWVTDLSQLMLLWMVMMGTVAAYCYNEHIVTGYLDGKLRGTALKVLLVVLRVLEALFFLILIIAGYAVASVRAGIPYVQLGISTGWTYVSIPVAGVLLLIAAAARPLSVADPSRNAVLELREDPDDSQPK